VAGLAEALSSGEILFKPVNFSSEPLLQNLLALARIEGRYRSAFMIEWNMVTRNIFGFAGLWNILPEDALPARMAPQRIAKVQAGERVLERRCGLVRRTNRPAVSAVLNEGQFEF